MTIRKTVVVSALFLAAALPVSLLFTGNAQLNVKNGALTGITTMPEYFPMGEITMVGNAVATDITVQSTEVLVAGTTTLTSGVIKFDMPQNNRLRYTGTTTGLMHVACTISYTVASGSNQELEFRLYKNGSPVATSEILDTCSAATGNESTAIHVFISLATNDYLELWCANNSGTGDITVKTLNLFALGIH
jgi:hypothetical protein